MRVNVQNGRPAKPLHERNRAGDRAGSVKGTHELKSQLFESGVSLKTWTPHFSHERGDLSGEVKIQWACFP